MRIETLADLHRRNATLHPARTACCYDGQRTSFADLHRRASNLAASWLRQGLGRGDRIAILARNRTGYVVALAACELAGFVAVGLNHRLSAEELSDICADCEASLLVFETTFTAAAQAITSGAGRAPRLLNMDAPEFHDWSEQPADSASWPVNPEDLAYLLYTSGTTGKPKGVMLSHAGLVATARGIAMEIAPQADDLLLAVMPLFHIGARCKTLGYAYRGAAVWLQDHFDAAQLLNDTANAGITAWHLAPSMVQRVIEEQRREQRALHRLRALHYAAAPMALPILQEALALFGPVLRQFYGMTETGAAGTVLQPTDHVLPPAGSPPDPRLGSAGQPTPDCNIRIVLEDGSEADIGQPGEVEIDSPANMMGYWRNPQATQQTLHDGWVRTGDIGYLDAARYLTLLDRKKELVISGGENIFPREVEDTLLSHHAVAEAAVIGVPDEQWGEAVLAFVVCRPGILPDAQELIDHVRSRIASFKKPREIRFVDDLPKLATGKVDKKGLRAPFWAGRARQV